MLEILNNALSVTMDRWEKTEKLIYMATGITLGNRERKISILLLSYYDMKIWAELEFSILKQIISYSFK